MHDYTFYVEHVGQQGLGGRVQLLHLALDCQGFQGDLLAGPGHPEEPGDPLEEDDPHPGGHVVGVGLPVVVVQDHDGRHHARRHHEHDAVEISACKGGLEWREGGLESSTKHASKDEMKL